MRVIFWGTRGSLPTPLNAAGVRQKIVNALVKGAGRGLDTPEKAEAFCAEHLSFAERGTFGGNTACVQVDLGGPEYLVCDLGSGLREFAWSAIRAHAPRTPQTYHFLVSHVHWDHIMGFPFFLPAYLPGNRIRIYSCHDRLEEAIRRQYSAPSFPVDFSALRATIEFVHLKPGRSYPIAGATVTGKAQLHGDDSYGYRIEKDGKSVVYTTDSEHKMEDMAEIRGFVEFFRRADLVIFDSMYSLADAMSLKEDWGHSSNVVGVELCQMAEARHLCLFHHEPVFDDDAIEAMLAETRRLEEITRGAAALRISAAYDGLEIPL